MIRSLAMTFFFQSPHCKKHFRKLDDSTYYSFPYSNWPHACSLCMYVITQWLSGTYFLEQSILCQSLCSGPLFSLLINQCTMILWYVIRRTHENGLRGFGGRWWVTSPINHLMFWVFCRGSILGKEVRSFCTSAEIALAKFQSNWGETKKRTASVSERFCSFIYSQFASFPSFSVFSK